MNKCEISDFKRALKLANLKFSFKKKDGTVRNAVGTMAVESLPESTDKVTYKCTNIVYDVETDDGIPAPVTLPKSVIVKLDAADVEACRGDAEQLESMIVDELSEKTGWLIESYSYERKYPKKLAEGTIFYYDLEKKGYRSFNESQLIDWNYMPN